MVSYKVIKYTVSKLEAWNNFVLKSKNGTFLFNRNFMEYHQDRFQDYSLMVYRNEKLTAILPGNILENNLYSHQGLTYGGLVLPSDIKFEVVLEIYKTLLEFLSLNGVEHLVLKKTPKIYCAYFTEETQYLMFLLKAELLKRETLSVISLNAKIKISKNRLEGFKRGIKHGLVIKEEDNFELFWNNILIKNLKKKHNAKPVHSLSDITLLKRRFPKNIRQFNVYYKDVIVAGTTIFESDLVAHSQYISGSENNNVLGSLDFLHVHLINEVFKNKKYFDFGSSNENNGAHINKGLQFWKEGFGARTVTQDFYKISTDNHHALNTVFI